MINRDLYETDPSKNVLLNQGVAKVSIGRSEAEIQTLRYELSTFVCEGQYAKGLERILDAYLKNLEKTEQPGVWVSGFYGSGKSHLVKMLQYLWTDYGFPDGARARGLARLSQGVKDRLAELSTAAKRSGGAHAAAGVPGSAGDGRSARLELLRILFKSVDLPEEYPQASFIVWLRQEGIEKEVRSLVEQAGKVFDVELKHLYVSDAIPRALLKVRPDFAGSIAEARAILVGQFKDEMEISSDNMIKSIKAAIAPDGRFPLLLVVLDETQQYIGDNPERSMKIQELVEECASKIGSRVLVVATGQNALSATPTLKRLQGRFPVAVELSDADVEQVTREVVLKKKVSELPKLQTFLNEHSGEIERHLKNTRVAFQPADRPLLPHDYPILPVRRRFWEHVCRAVEKSAGAAQLRTQLRIVHEAALHTAHLPLGNVIEASFLHDLIRSQLIQSGVLLQEIDAKIEGQANDQKPDGDLRRKLCALIFLIAQLPREAAVDLKIRADAETLADLVVSNLSEGSLELRRKIPQVLNSLATDGSLMKVDDEFRIQTREGSEWTLLYHNRFNEMMSDPAKLAGERRDLLVNRFKKKLSGFSLTQGSSKESRKLDLHFGDENPKKNDLSIPVWVRSGWEIEADRFRGEARSMGEKAAVIVCHIPMKKSDDLNRAVASAFAARKTLEVKGSAAITREALEAKKSMETSVAESERRRDDLIDDLIEDAAVILAGGDDVEGSGILDKIRDAANSALDRLFPKFHHADHPDWSKALERARKNDRSALEVINHHADPDSHPVCQEVIKFVTSGRKGKEIRDQFRNPPFGWPQDAVDAALAVLVCNGKILAKIHGEQVHAAKLDHKSIAGAEFRVETVSLSAKQLIDIRKLFLDLKVNCAGGEESQKSDEFLERLIDLARSAGGDPPVPPAPGIDDLIDIRGKNGNYRLGAIHQALVDLRKKIQTWKQTSALIAERKHEWITLKNLLDHASDLAIAREIAPQVEALERDRSLLANPNPVSSLVAKLADALRSELNRMKTLCEQEMKKGQAELSNSPAWTALDQDRRDELTKIRRLAELPPISVENPLKIVESLNHTKIKDWANLADALPKRFQQAADDAAKLLEPKAKRVKLPSRTIKNDADLKLWLDDAKSSIELELKDGPVIL